MSKCESNVDELIVPGLVGIPGTVSSRLAEYRDWRGDVQADVSDLETCALNLEIQGLAITAIDFVNPCARYSEVSFELGDDAIHARLIEPVGRARVSERVPLCLMFHDIDRPVRGWHHMTRFAALGYAVLALDDDVAGADDLRRGISSPAFVERVRWGCGVGVLRLRRARASGGVALLRRGRGILIASTPTASLHGARVLVAESRWRFLLWTSGASPARRLPIRFLAASRRCRLGCADRCSWAHRSWMPRATPRASLPYSTVLSVTGGISSMPNTLTSASMRSKTKSSTSLTKRSTRVLWPRRPGHCQQEWVAQGRPPDN